MNDSIVFGLAFDYQDYIMQSLPDIVGSVLCLVLCLIAYGYELELKSPANRCKPGLFPSVFVWFKWVVAAAMMMLISDAIFCWNSSDPKIALIALRLEVTFAASVMFFWWMLSNVIVQAKPTLTDFWTNFILFGLGGIMPLLCSTYYLGLQEGPGQYNGIIGRFEAKPLFFTYLALLVQGFVGMAQLTRYDILLRKGELPMGSKKFVDNYLSSFRMCLYGGWAVFASTVFTFLNIILFPRWNCPLFGVVIIVFCGLISYSLGRDATGAIRRSKGSDTNRGNGSGGEIAGQD